MKIGLDPVPIFPIPCGGGSGEPASQPESTEATSSTASLPLGGAKPYGVGEFWEQRRGRQSADYVVAAGPFTTTDNIFFEPLVELLAHASRKQPQLLILMGPFLDSEHPYIKKGTVDRTFDEIFHTEIIRRLLDYTGYMGSAAQVVLMPSQRDANHDLVFPQAHIWRRVDIKPFLLVTGQHL